MRRVPSFLAASGLAGIMALRALAAPGDDTARAVIAPGKTSIYLGSVTLAVEPLVRDGSVYSSSYSATVFPFFFCNEKGKFEIEVPDSSLFQLARGRPIDFVGQAVRADGVVRTVQGHAVPHGLTDDGEVKIRVRLSRRIVLVFNTTYHLIAGGK
jgi:hypothetical protein